MRRFRGPTLCLQPSERTQFFACLGAAVLLKIFYRLGLPALLDHLVFPRRETPYPSGHAILDKA